VKAIYDLFKFQRLASRDIINLTRKVQEESAIEIICRFDYYKYVVPIQFAYAKSRGIDITEGLIQLLNEVVSEKNAIMDK
jgi:hypothetical protein